MEAHAAARAPAGVPVLSLGRLRLATDSQLVAQVRAGRNAAFETIFDRHHRGILSFCRHMLGDQGEAEDAVQHTFMAAYGEMVSSAKAIQLKPWLYAIARNRCLSVLRSRRAAPAGLEDLELSSTEGLAALVQRRQDLRDLVHDLAELPDDQRGALLLSEVHALSHREIAEVIAVPPEKVKALVFQAREALIANRTAREIDCADIRIELANSRGAALRRAHLRRHLRHCSGCSDFRRDLNRQRRQLSMLIPVLPSAALREAAVTAAGGSAAVAGGGGLIASTMLKGGLVKLVASAAVAVTAVGTLVVSHSLHTLFGSQNRPQMHWLSATAPFAGRTAGSPAEASRKPGTSGSARFVVARAGAPVAGAPLLAIHRAPASAAPHTMLRASGVGWHHGGHAPARVRTGSRAAPRAVIPTTPAVSQTPVAPVAPAIHDGAWSGGGHVSDHEGDHGGGTAGAGSGDGKAGWSGRGDTGQGHDGGSRTGPAAGPSGGGSGGWGGSGRGAGAGGAGSGRAGAPDTGSGSGASGAGAAGSGSGPGGSGWGGSSSGSSGGHDSGGQGRDSGGQGGNAGGQGGNSGH